MEYPTLTIIFASICGFFMAWGIGANDVANAMGTSVGSKAITLFKAIIIAAVFESLGALLAGGAVTDTIRNDIINPQSFSYNPNLLIDGMLAALLAAGSWLLIASRKGWPVSTTHSIIGAIIGFGFIELGHDAIEWSNVLNILLSWLVTPIIAGAIAYLIFISIQKFIINTQEPVLHAKRLLPFYIFFAALIIALVTVFKGLKHLGLTITSGEGVTIAISFGLLAMALSYYSLHHYLKKIPKLNNITEKYQRVERIFGLLMIFTASSMAFAHGSNDVANAIGPLAAIISIVKSGGVIAIQAHLPRWELLLGAIGIVLGLATYGYRVIATIGEKITFLTPSRGFAAELATATTVVIASGTGLPISTTQTLVGAVLGVGFARGIGALNLKVIRNIFMSWVITLPAGAILAILYFLILKFLL